jgi:hypothetical protein
MTPPTAACQVEVALLAEFVTVLRDNASYMEKEAPGLADSQQVKAAIAERCASLASLAWDLADEVINLQDKLGLRAGEPPHDPAIVNPDPRVTLTFFRNWPVEELSKLNDLVESLRVDNMAQTGSSGLSFILVAESATNILNAYIRAIDAVDRIQALTVDSSKTWALAIINNLSR